jgi:hypothetical protein
MILPYAKALDLVKSFDGETSSVTDFLKAIDRAKANCKDKLEEDVWVSSLEDRRPLKNAKTTIQRIFRNRNTK